MNTAPPNRTNQFSFNHALDDLRGQDVLQDETGKRVLTGMMEKYKRLSVFCPISQGSKTFL